MSELNREGLSALGLGGCVCIKAEGVCLHWDREGVPALRQRVSVCIKGECFCLY